jgi:hypothetical protein
MRGTGYTLGQAVRDVDRALLSMTNLWPIRWTFSRSIAPDSAADAAENSPQLMRDLGESGFYAVIIYSLCGVYFCGAADRPIRRN